MLFSGGPIGDVSVELRATGDISQTITTYTLSIHSPLGDECGSTDLPLFGVNSVRTTTISTGNCIFDGCQPRVKIALKTGVTVGAELELHAVSVTTTDGTTILDEVWSESLGGSNPASKSVTMPIPLEQDALDMEYVRTSECFSQLFTSRSGDPITVNDPLFGVGNVVQYCLRAVGSVGDEGYASPKVCTNHRMRFQSTLTGRVQTETGVGVKGVSVSGHLLDLAESADGSISFVQVGGRRRRDGDVVITESLDWRLDRSCPKQTVARDENGRPLKASWEETPSTQIAVVQCPVYGLQLAASVTRRCAADGRWGEPNGACESAVRAFSEVLGIEAIGSSDFLTRLTPFTQDACAWECLFLSEDCRGFQFVAETQTCLLVRGIKLATLPLAGVGVSTGLFAIHADVVAQTRPLTVAPADSVTGAAVWCSLEDSPTGDGSADSPIALGSRVKGGLGHDALLGAIFEYNAQLNTLRDAKCTHLTGNLVVRGQDGLSLEERCRLNTRATFRDLLCQEASEANITQYQGSCVENVRFTFGVENSMLKADLTKLMRRARKLNPTLLSSCTLGALDEFHDLNALKHLTFVKGAVVIEDALRLRNFDGGLAKLEFIGSMWTTTDDAEPVHMTITNTGLQGGLRFVLPYIRDTLITARLVDNAELCVLNNVFDWPASWIISGNAALAACGCMAPVAGNFNPQATFSDSSCVMTACAVCHAGTHGPCAYADHDNDQICREALDVRVPSGSPKFLRCPVGSTACSTDLCNNVLCNNPPACQVIFPGADLAVGQCDGGVCQYAFEPAGSSCDDSNAATGPDSCNDAGRCIGQSSCVIGELTGVKHPEFGSSINTQAHLNAVAGCVIIDGHVHVDCHDNTSITDLSALGSVVGISGGLIIENCPGVTSLAHALAGLALIAGEAEGSSVLIRNNPGLLGSLPFDAPSLASGKSLAEFRVVRGMSFRAGPSPISHSDSPPRPPSPRERSLCRCGLMQSKERSRLSTTRSIASTCESSTSTGWTLTTPIAASADAHRWASKGTMPVSNSTTAAAFPSTSVRMLCASRSTHVPRWPATVPRGCAACSPPRPLVPAVTMATASPAPLVSAWSHRTSPRWRVASTWSVGRLNLPVYLNATYWTSVT